MTPAEKAKDLLDKFEYIDLLKDVGGMDIELAKQCVAVCIDEIIQAEQNITSELLDGYIDTDTLVFWQNVKDELEPL